MMLESASGYSMPFLPVNREPEIILDYGDQKHPETGDDFFHHGIDITTSPQEPLLAMASGVVSGVGESSPRGPYINVRYGEYEVQYAHITHPYVNYGTIVYAGNAIARANDFIHIGVTFRDNELNPKDFLLMIYNNVITTGMVGEDIGFPDVKINTGYDASQAELEGLLQQFLPLYLNDMMSGSYRLANEVEEDMRNLLLRAAQRGYFYEQLPSIPNPLGMAQRSTPLISKMQTLLIRDFLNYLAVRKNVFLSSMNDSQKKNFLSNCTDEARYTDPLKNLAVSVQTFDIPRKASVWPDNGGIRWWTKAWFNHHDKGETAVEVSREKAVRFLHGEISLDEWLDMYFAKQMNIYRNAIQQTYDKILKMQLS